MKLEDKIAIGIIIAGISVIISMLLIREFILVPTYNNIETKFAQKDIINLHSTIENSFKNIKIKIKDWSSWDDTLYFSKNQNPEYIKSNLVETTFENLELNIIAITNDSEDIIYLEYHDYQKGIKKNIDNTFLNDFKENVVNIDKTDSTTGIITINNTAFIMSIQKITDSNEEVHSNNSYIVFAKHLHGKEFIDNIINHLQLPLSIHEETIDIPKNNILISSKQFVNQIDIEQGKGQTNVPSLLGNKDYVFEIQLPQDMHRHISKAANMFFILMAIVVTATTIWVTLFVKKSTVEPIEEINSTIKDIIKTKDLSKKIQFSADEELEELMNNFNNLTKKLKQREDLLNKKNNEISKTYNQLKKLTKTKDEFLSNISHELRTPLTSIKSYMQLLESNVFTKKTDIKEAQDIVLQSTEDLIELINNLLDITKYEKHKMLLMPQKTNILTIIEEIKKEVKGQIKKLGGTFEIVANIKNTTTRCDKEKIKRAILNLVSNSIKYRSEELLKITAEINEINHKQIEIKISDNGIGISKENKKNLFNKFYQVDQSMTKKVSGTGLGLTIVKDIVKLHKGTIKVKSQLKRGSTFSIILPKK